MFNSDYRQIAREAVQRARALLTNIDSPSLHYAALECRFALEALTYDRAKAFKDDLPETEYSTWQPSKLMKVLFEIDPKILMTSTISFAPQADEGMPAPRGSGILLGTDTPLTISDIKRRYDALGSYLHVPTIKQLAAGRTPEYGEVRAKCEEVLEIAEGVLRSKVWNCTLGHHGHLEKCMRKKCGRPIRVRFPIGEETVIVKCHNEHCPATYEVTAGEGSVSVWKPIFHDFPCSSDGCDEKIRLWDSEVKEGEKWRCSKCNAQHEFALIQMRVE